MVLANPNHIYLQVIGGHHHTYQRSCPVFQGKCQLEKQGKPDDPNAKGRAPIHLVIGHGGKRGFCSCAHA